MKMIAFNGSHRTEGYTAQALDIMLSVARSEGYEVERIELTNLNIGYCKGCKECDNRVGCTQRDDMDGVYEKLTEADHIIIGSPIYMGSETGATKCFLDRLYALLEPKEDGGFSCRLPSGKSYTVVLVCSSSDGHIVYHYLTNRFMRIMMGLLGADDFAAFIVPATSKLENIKESTLFRENLDSFRYRL